MAIATKTEKVFFCLTSGRSGTTYLSSLIRNNVADIACKHEPRPDLFGEPVLWRHEGAVDLIRERFQKKARRIESCRRSAYFETNHAFLKSFADVAVERYPEMKLCHLIRDPLKVARSEANREQDARNIIKPFRPYLPRSFFKSNRYALTGLEPIFQDSTLESMSRFQFFVLQWIEVENRAMAFLDRHDKHEDCFTIHTPGDFGDAAKVEALFDFMDLPRKRRKSEASLEGGRQNRNITPTVISDETLMEFEAVLKSIPSSYFEIFHHAPYDDQAWADVLREGGF
jgi:hypothetical protein